MNEMAIRAHLVVMANDAENRLDNEECNRQTIVEDMIRELRDLAFGKELA